MFRAALLCAAILVPTLSHADGVNTLLNGLKNAMIEKAKQKAGIATPAETNGAPAPGTVAGCPDYEKSVKGDNRLFRSPPACALQPRTDGSIIIGSDGYAHVDGKVWGLYFLLRNLVDSKTLGPAAAEPIALSAALDARYFKADTFAKKDLIPEGRERVKELMPIFTKDKTYVFPAWVTFYQYNFEKQAFPVHVAMVEFSGTATFGELNDQVPIGATFDGVHFRTHIVGDESPNHYIKVEDETKARAMRSEYMKLGPNRILAAVVAKPVDTSYRPDLEPNVIGSYDINFAIQRFEFFDRSGKPVTLLEP